ncbi:unnamed protein product [Pseudo-nitzschia multistriata]|uniref:Uncharacterized protein n=1 Tax=Pseudo-nitzschia multistriata TaxID=183589 RepID=A0A448ZC91_9STRA|nr:unnamed protein product [Pseudo-nitzschia multistriata]
MHRRSNEKMKRSNQGEIRKRSAHRNDVHSSQSRIVPILIEDEVLSGRYKCSRNETYALDLLVRATVEVKPTSISACTRLQSPTIYSGPSPGITKSSIDRVPSENFSASSALPNRDFFPGVSSSSLPNGRPLSPPPHLPTLIPCQPGCVATNLMPLETTLLPRENEFQEIKKTRLLESNIVCLRQHQRKAGATEFTVVSKKCKVLSNDDIE